MGTPAGAAHGRRRGGAYSCSWGGCVRLLLGGGCVRLLLWGRACLAPPGCVPLPSVGGGYRLLGGTYRSCQLLVAAYWLRARPTDGRGGTGVAAVSSVATPAVWRGTVVALGVGAGGPAGWWWRLPLLRRCGLGRSRRCARAGGWSDWVVGTPSATPAVRRGTVAALSVGAGGPAGWWLRLPPPRRAARDGRDGASGRGGGRPRVAVMPAAPHDGPSTRCSRADGAAAGAD